MAIKHALVVDDSRSARHMLRTMLEKNDLSVDQCESGQEAIDYLSHKRPDIIFMDHMMPGMDGLQATKIINNNPETNAIPIIMYTSKDDPEYADEAKAHGAVGILPKPANWPLLNDLLQQITARKISGGKPTLVPTSPAPVAANSPIVPEEKMADIESNVMARVKELLTETSSSITARCIEMVDLATNRTNALIGTQEQETGTLVNSMLGDFQAKVISEVREQIKLELNDLATAKFASLRVQLEEALQAQMRDSVKQALFVYEAQEKAINQPKEIDVEEIRTSIANELGPQFEAVARRVSKQEVQSNAEQFHKDAAIRLTTETLAKQRETIATAKRYAIIAALVGIGAALISHFIN